jgi:hypothetical protein
MRRIGVSVLLVALLATLVGFVVSRRLGVSGTEAETGTEAAAEAETGSEAEAETGSEAEAETGTGTGTGAGTGAEAEAATGSEAEAETGTGMGAGTGAEAEAATGSEAEAATGTGAGTGAEAEASVESLLDRPLRVISTHWEVAAPILLASGGASSVEGSILDRAGLRQELRVSARASDLEEALARGGAEANGADLAILPLATWVASYEHLAALETEIFFVAAWSRGSQVVFASPEATPSERVPASFSIAGARGSAESLSVLLLLSEMGVSPERVRFTASDDAAALLSAAEREGPDAELRARNRVPWLSTADASHLSPWVVVAPRGFVREHQPVLAAWARAWLEGREMLARDVPAGARSIAAITGAPPLVDLLRRLGQLESVGLVEQAELAGLSGRSYVTLEVLFRRAWSIDRAIGVLSGPPPEVLPIATGTIATLVRRETPTPLERAAFRAAPEPRVLASFPLTLPRASRGGDAAGTDAAVARVGFVAGVFPRSGLRVVAPRQQASTARALADRAIEQYGLDPARLEVTTGTTASLRVLAPE